MKTTKPATMYRQGRGWIVSVYDPAVKAARLTQEMSYWQARAMVGRRNCPKRHQERCDRHEYH